VARPISKKRTCDGARRPVEVIESHHASSLAVDGPVLKVGRLAIFARPSSTANTFSPGPLSTVCKVCANGSFFGLGFFPLIGPCLFFSPHFWSPRSFVHLAEGFGVRRPTFPPRHVHPFQILVSGQNPPEAIPRPSSSPEFPFFPFPGNCTLFFRTHCLLSTAGFPPRIPRSIHKGPPKVRCPHLSSPWTFFFPPATGSRFDYARILLEPVLIVIPSAPYSPRGRSGWGASRVTKLFFRFHSFGRGLLRTFNKASPVNKEECFFSVSSFFPFLVVGES